MRTVTQTINRVTGPNPVNNIQIFNFELKEDQINKCIPNTTKIVLFCKKNNFTHLVPVLTNVEENMGKQQFNTTEMIERFRTYNWIQKDGKVSKSYGSIQIEGQNLAIVVPKGFVVIDIDNQTKQKGGNGLDYFTMLVQDNGYSSIEDYCIKERVNYTGSPSEGYHLYFRIQNNFLEKICKEFIHCDTIDIKKEGEFIIAPYSIYQSCVPRHHYDPKTQTYGKLVETPHKCGGNHDNCKYKGKMYTPFFRDMTEIVQKRKELDIEEYKEYLKMKIVEEDGKEFNEITEEDISKYGEQYNYVPDWLCKEFIVKEKLSELEFDNSNEVLNENNDLTFVEELIECCKPVFLAKRDPWVQMIWLIKALLGENGRDIVHKYSSLHLGYNQSETDKNFDDGKPLFWNIKHLRAVAKRCDPIKYYELCKKSITNYYLFQGDRGLAYLYQKCIEGKHVITDEESFKGYAWDEKSKLWISRSSSYFKKELGDVLINYITNVMKEFEIESKKELEKSESDDKSTPEEIGKSKSKIEEKKKQLKTVRKYIESSSGQRNIFTQGAMLILDRNFEKNLNNKSDELPLKNGKIICLQNGETRDRSITDLWDYECPVNYLGIDADTSIAYSFMLDITRIYRHEENREDLAKWLCKVMGYFLTKEIMDRSLYIFYGKHGRNGKSTLMNIMENILVTNKGYVICSSNIVLKSGIRRMGSHTAELMPLKNARLAITSEPATNDDKKSVLDTERIKELTGGDSITGRGLRKEEETFTPKCKIVLLCNNYPIGDNSSAWKARVKSSSFDNQFEITKENNLKCQELKSKYLDQFFTLFVNYGIQWWEDRDLSLPDAAKEATEIYFEKTNIFKQFINEKVENNEFILEENGTIQANIFYKMYQEWYIRTTKLNISLEDFKEQATKYFIFKKTKFCNNYLGLRLLTDEDNEEL